jgi:three-Cys-motif partner protein
MCTVDAFAGTGYHLSKTTGEMVLGSPLNALLVRPRFREYHLIDLDGDKIAGLNEMIGKRQDVFVHKGNCNHVLLREVFPEFSVGISKVGGQKGTMLARPLQVDP